MNNKPIAFDNGLSEEEDDLILDLMSDIAHIRVLIGEKLPRHRSYSLALTKLEEAEHWLRDRRFKPASNGGS